ncbi:MAG: hypothetical protein WCK92_01610 [Bacteroidota bacterium]
MKYSKATHPETYGDGFQILHGSNGYYEEIGKVFIKKVPTSTDPILRFQLDNHIFYVSDITKMIKTLVDGFKLTNLTIERLDISHDTDEDMVSKFKEWYYDTELTFKNKNKVSVQSTGPDDFNVKIGSIKSHKSCISIYDKTREINKTKNKEYIRKSHQNVFGCKNIFRVEVKLFDKILKEYPDLNIMSLNNKDYLETIFNQFYKRLVRFTNKDGVEVDIIPLSNEGKFIEQKKKPRNKGGSIKIKEYINFLDKESNSKEFQRHKKPLSEVRSILINKYGLEVWDKLNQMKKKQH